MKISKWSLRIGIAVIAVGLTFTGTVQAQRNGKGKEDINVSYQIVPLDTADEFGQTLSGYVRDVNNSKLVVGCITQENGEENWNEAVCWSVTSTSGDVTSNLFFLDQGIYPRSQAWGCNELGQMVGEVNSPSLDYWLAHACFWSNLDSSPQILPSPYDYSQARAINQERIICGQSNGPTGETLAIVWANSAGTWRYYVLPALGTPGWDAMGVPLPNRSTAFDISDSDSETGLLHVVGRSNGNATRWTLSVNASAELSLVQATILDSESEAVAVNANGLTVGWSHLGPSDGGDGVVWELNGVRMLLPGTLRGKPARPTQVWPNDTNDSGVIVGDDGWDAIVWLTPTSSPVRLSDFLPKRTSQTFASLYTATAINQRGDIVGQGSFSEFGPLPPFIAIPK